MKKILMTLSLALAAMIAIPSVASAQDTSTGAKTEQCQKKDCKKGDKKGDRKGGKKGSKKGGKFAKGGKQQCCKDSVSLRMIGGRKGNPLMKDITLTPEQETKMTELMNARRADMAKMKEASKQDKAAMKAQYKEQMQKNQEAMDKEVQKILNADQLKQYEANKAKMQEMKAKKAELKAAKGDVKRVKGEMKQMKGGKGMKKGMHAQAKQAVATSQAASK